MTNDADATFEPLLADLRDLNEEIVACRRCPRLVQWREQVASEKRKSFEDWDYWGKPVPVFGDPFATHLIVGLAPAAHGANRTGRMFTGDRSGEWLYRALYRAGVASQANADHANDGLRLRGVMIAASAHCAPPDNRPSPDELNNCSPFLARVLDSRAWGGVLCLGGLAWDHVHRLLQVPKCRFGHGVVHEPSQGPRLVASYHPSQQNTFTGRLTEQMLDEAVRVWLEAVPTFTR